MVLSVGKELQQEGKGMMLGPLGHLTEVTKPGWTLVTFQFVSVEVGPYFTLGGQWTLLSMLLV